MSKLAKNTLKADKLTVLADKGYYAANEFAECLNNNINVLVSKVTSAPDRNYSKTNFIYDKESNCYICPQGKILSYKERKPNSRTPGTRYSNPKACKICLVKERCTKNKYRCIFDRPFQRYADEVDKNTKINMELYKKRQQIVEHAFGSVKRNLGYTYFLTVGKEKVLTESFLHFLAYNMKRAIKVLGIKGINGIIFSLFSKNKRIDSNIFKFKHNLFFFLHSLR